MTNEYGNELLHKVLLSAMKDIDKICRENGLKYYLYAGTLLGAVNYKGFIPWDDDVDIVMFPDDLEKLKKIIESDYSSYYRFMTFENTPNWYSKMCKLQILGTSIVSQNSERSPVFIDISKLHSMPDSAIQRFFQRKEIELLNLSLAVLSGEIKPISLKSRLTIAQIAKFGKDKIGVMLDRTLTKYDNVRTKSVGIMCNTLTANPYTGISGYDTDKTERAWHEKYQYISFEDTSLMTFSHIENYLDWQYTKAWRNPYPEEKRITKHDVKTYEIEPWVMERIK